MDKQWTCKCGRVNDGRVCKDCGNDKPQISNDVIEKARKTVNGEMHKFLTSGMPTVIAILMFAAAAAMIVVTALLIVSALDTPEIINEMGNSNVSHIWDLNIYNHEIIVAYERGYKNSWDVILALDNLRPALDVADMPSVASLLKSNIGSLSECSGNPLWLLKILAVSVTGFSGSWGIVSAVILLLGSAVFMIISGIYTIGIAPAVKQSAENLPPVHNLLKTLSVFRVFALIAIGVFAFVSIINTAGGYELHMNEQLNDDMTFFFDMAGMWGSLLQALYFYIPMIIVVVSYSAAIISTWIVFKAAIGFIDRFLYRHNDPTSLHSDCRFSIVGSFVFGGILAGTTLLLILLFIWTSAASMGYIPMTPLLYLSIVTAVLSAIMFVLGITANNYEKLQQRIAPAIKEVNNGEF